MPKQEIVDSPAEQTQVMMAMPVNPVQFANDQRLRDRAARRRDPNARQQAQATLDAAPKVTVVLNPTEEDRRYGDAHLDKDGNPRYPLWTCTYNGIPLSYEVGVPIEMPTYVYELYAHSMRLPVFRKAPGDPGQVFVREIPESGGVYESPDFGR